MRFSLITKLIVFFNIIITANVMAVSENDNFDDRNKIHAREIARNYFNTPVFYPDGYAKRADYTTSDEKHLSFKACQLNTLLKIIDTCHFMHVTAGSNSFRHEGTPKHLISYIDEIFQTLHHEFYELFINDHYSNIYHQKIPLFASNDTRFLPLLILGKTKHNTLILDEAKRTELLFKNLESYLINIYERLQPRRAN